MFGTFGDTLGTIWGALRVADVIDILVVTVIVYGGIRWFRQSRSRLVMSGLATLAVLYLAAGLLDMHLTLALFQAGITVAAVALVVIFQDEIRRGFERVALASRFRGASREGGADGEVDTVVEAVSALASSKTGALVVFKGRDPLERHLTGGIPLNGRLSEPLMYSIFDTGSAGHDGALVIEDGVVTRFGAHLPLSVEISGRERFGTRHTAAIGLSERCDALVVVVSEERGVISVAQNGKLEALASGTALKKRITDFKARVSPDGKSRVFTRNIGIKLLSLAIAIGAWLVTFGYRNETSIRTVSAPVVFRDVPAGWLVEDTTPLEVLVSVSGPQRALERLRTSQVSAAVDLSEIEAGQQRASISTSEVLVPSGVLVRDVEPNLVRFKAERTSTETLPVEIRTRGNLPRGYRLGALSVEPSSVAVILPRSSRALIKRIPTEPIPLSELRSSTSLTTALLLPQRTALAAGQPNSVTVRVVIQASMAP
jgi:uncharacterized protein (TIGR00159 family)